MANTASQGGLRLFKGDPTQNLEMVCFTTSESNNIGIGDAVVTSSGNATNDGYGGPNARAVAKASTSGAIFGVIMGFLPHMVNGNTNPNLSIVYRAASTFMYAVVRRAVPTDRYLISDDGTAIGIAGIGKNGNLVANACNTATGLSEMTLNHTVATSNATYQLKVTGILDNPLNNPAVGNAVYEVSINNCEIGSGTGTVGV